MSEILNLSALIKQERPNMSQLLKCEDIVSSYKMKNRELCQFIVSREALLDIIKVFLATKDPQILSNVSQLFTSTNTTLLKFFTEDIIFTDKLLSFLESDGAPYHPRVITATLILSSAFNYWPQEMTKIFQTSEKIVPLLTRHIDLLPVSAFFSANLLKSTDQESFPWYLFLSIMDEHGPGAIRPFHIQWERNDFTRLSAEQRCRAIELIIQYFKTFPDRIDLIKIITKALPLLLTDASTDYEKTLIFKLGILLECNNAVVRSAISYVNAYPSVSPLLLSCLKYLAFFHIEMEPEDVEVLFYRFVRTNQHNNLISNHILQIVANSARNNPNLQNGLKQLISVAYEKNPSCSSLLMRAFGFSVLGSLEGLDDDPLSNQFADLVINNRDEQFSELVLEERDKDSPEVLLENRDQQYSDVIIENREKHPIDKPFIKSVMERSKKGQEAVFDAKSLWGSDCQCLSCSFSTIQRLAHLKPPQTQQQVIIQQQQQLPKPKIEQTTRSRSTDDKNNKSNDSKIENSKPRSPKGMRSKSPQIVHDRSNDCISPRGSHDDSDLPAKQTRFDDSSSSASVNGAQRTPDLKPRKTLLETRRQNSPPKQHSHKRTHSAEIEITDIQNEKSTGIRYLNRTTIASLKHQTYTFDDDKEYLKTKQFVKAPPAPPSQPAPHRASTISPHGKKKNDEFLHVLNKSPSPPPQQQQTLSMQPVSQPPFSNPVSSKDVPTLLPIIIPPRRVQLQMCTLDAFEYIQEPIPKHECYVQTEAIPEKPPVRLVIDVFDPLQTKTETMPQLQQRRNIDNDQLKQAQQQQPKSIIVPLKLPSQIQSSMKQKKMYMAEDQQETMHPRSPPQRPQYLSPFDDNPTPQLPIQIQMQPQSPNPTLVMIPKNMKVKHDDKAGILPPKIPRKGVWDDNKNDRPPRGAAPPIVPKPNNHAEFPNIV